MYSTCTVPPVTAMPPLNTASSNSPLLCSSFSSSFPRKKYKDIIRLYLYARVHVPMALRYEVQRKCNIHCTVEHAYEIYISSSHGLFDFPEKTWHPVTGSCPLCSQTCTCTCTCSVIETRQRQATTPKDNSSFPREKKKSCTEKKKSEQLQL